MSNTMKPTYNTFPLCVYAGIVGINTFTMLTNFATDKLFLAICNSVVVGCFVVIGMSEFKKFFRYCKEMKAYQSEQKELKTKQLEAFFCAEMKSKRTKELQEKFSHF